MRINEKIIQEKDEVIADLKKNMKVTKLNECETFLRQSENECIRLRQLLKEALDSQKGGPLKGPIDNRKVLELSVALKEAKRKNAEILVELTKKTTECMKLNEELKTFKGGSTAKQKKTLIDYKEKLNELTKEIEQLKTIPHKPEQESSKLEKCVKEYEAKVELMNKELADKEDTIKQMTNKLKEKSTIESKDQLQVHHSVSHPIIKEANIRDIVTYQDIYYILIEIRVLLILNRTDKERLVKQVFEVYEDNEPISIKELSKSFTKKPLELMNEKSEILARYIIEPRDNPKIDYSIYRDIATLNAKKNLDEVLEIPYTIPSDKETFEDLVNSALTKVKTLATKDIEAKVINIKEWSEVIQNNVSSLKEVEKDILLFICFEASRDINKLSLKVTFT